MTRKINTSIRIFTFTNQINFNVQRLCHKKKIPQNFQTVYVRYKLTYVS